MNQRKIAQVAKMIKETTLMKKAKILGMLLTVIIILAGCSVDQKKTIDYSDWGALQSFHYDYGSFHEGYVDYDLTAAEGLWTLRAVGSNGNDLNVEKAVKEEVIIELQQVLEEAEITNWDGFDDITDNVLDGYSFKLLVAYENHELQAQGYEKYPPNYLEAHDKLVTFLESLTQEDN